MVRKTSGRNSQSLETGGCSAAVEKCQGTYYLAFTLKLADKYSTERLEHACRAALERIPSPRYKNIRLILESGNDRAADPSNQSSETIHDESYALVRGASYYGGGSHEK